MSFGIADISELLLALGLDSSVTETQRALAQEALRVATGAVVRYLGYNPVKTLYTQYYPQADFRKGEGIAIWEVNDSVAYARQLSSAVVDELQVEHIPIRSITSLKVDYDGRFGTRSGSFADESLWVSGTDYWANWDLVDSEGDPVCRDGIIRCEGRWPDLPGSVKIVYYGGYTDKELHGQDSIINASPIMDAVIDESVRRFLKAMSRGKKRLAGFSGPFASESMGDYSYSVDTAIMGKLIGGNMDLLPETEHKLGSFKKYDLGVM